MHRNAHVRWSTAARLVLLAGLSAAAFNAVAAPLPQDTQSASDRIIVGPLSPHAFQNTAADDPGVDLAAEDINLPQLLATLGPDATLWYQHVMTLSNPFFEGRSPGLAGNRYAADYLEFWFRECTLEPAFPADVIADGKIADAEPLDGSEDSKASGHAASSESPSNGASDGEVEAGVVNEWISYRQPFLPHKDEERATDNVGGVLRGRGELADQWVIIGAHYDHTGYGRAREGEGRGPLNPGADDNASGTSAMLVLAKRLSEAYRAAGEEQPLRSILFMAFSAEEIGLLGSAHYVRNSTLRADKISLMINLDMVGRLRGGNLMVGGVESAEGLLDLIRPHLLESGLTIYADPSGQGPSDHAEFFGSGIPVLFFFTGTHDVYHRPGDVGSSVDPRGAVKVIHLVDAIAWDRATEPDMLKFLHSSRADLAVEERVRPPRPRATVGLVPGLVRDDQAPGVRVSILSDNSPASNAGVLVDDIITAWNGEAISSIVAWTSRLRASQPGQEVTLTILRGEEQFDIKITLGERR